MSTPAQLLEPLTNPSTATPEAITAAVEGFNVQVQAGGRPSEESVGNYVWEAFNALFDAAGRILPEHQAPLVEFLVRLQQTTARNADGEVLKLRSSEVWRDLPDFGMVARESLNYDAHDPKATQEERAVWENQAAYMARLTGLATEFDMSLYALWMLRDAFEEEEARNGLSRTAVRIAALWIRYAGELLRKLAAAEQQMYPERLGASLGKYREREWTGFNEERWEVWREGLKAAREQFGDDEVIKAAVEAMEKL